MKRKDFEKESENEREGSRKGMCTLAVGLAPAATSLHFICETNPFGVTQSCPGGGGPCR